MMAIIMLFLHLTQLPVGSYKRGPGGMEKPRLVVNLDIGISICITSISTGESLIISKNLSITFHQHKTFPV